MGIGITPTELVQRFAADGIKVSERELRRRARELGCCHEIGKAMFFTPNDIDRLIAGLATPPARAQMSGANVVRLPVGDYAVLVELREKQRLKASRTKSKPGNRRG